MPVRVCGVGGWVGVDVDVAVAVNVDVDVHIHVDIHVGMCMRWLGHPPPRRGTRQVEASVHRRLLHHTQLTRARPAHDHPGQATPLPRVEAAPVTVAAHATRR